MLIYWADKELRLVNNMFIFVGPTFFITFQFSVCLFLDCSLEQISTDAFSTPMLNGGGTNDALEQYVQQAAPSGAVYNNYLSLGQQTLSSVHIC